MDLHPPHLLLAVMFSLRLRFFSLSSSRLNTLFVYMLVVIITFATDKGFGLVGRKEEVEGELNSSKKTILEHHFRHQQSEIWLMILDYDYSEHAH